MPASKQVNLHGHSEYSSLDGYATVEQIALRAKELGQEATALTDHGECAGHFKFQKACREAGVKPIFGCLPAGAMIHTQDGARPVEDIEVGDLVWTHEGRLQPVTRVMSRWFSGELTEFGVGHSNRTVRLTGEHPILVSDYHGTTSWVLAQDLVSGRPDVRSSHHLTNRQRGHSWCSYAVVPRVSGTSRVTVRVPDHSSGGRFFEHRGSDFVRWHSMAGEYIWSGWGGDLVLDEDFARFLGLFVAEGAVAKSLNGAMTMTFNQGETDFVNFCVEWLSNRRVASSVYHRPERGTKELVFCCLPLALLLADLVGIGARSKRVPDVLFSADEKKKEIFLRGLMDGDGKWTGEIAYLKSSSRGLAWGVKMLAASLGSFGVVSTVQAKSPRGKWLEHYSVGVNFSDRWRRVRVFDDKIAIPIRSVRRYAWEGMVYNFSVHEDNSYVTDVVLHNCEGYWVPSIEEVKAAKKYPENISHMCLLAKTQRGLSNLWALSSIAYDRHHHYYRPLADPALMREYAEDLYCSDGCMITEFSRQIDRDDEDGARQTLSLLLDIFGDNFYMELHTWQYMEAETDEQKRLNRLMAKINQAKVRFASELSVPLVVVNDSHHVRPDDWYNRELVWQFNLRKNPDQTGDVPAPKADYLMGEDDLFSWMSRHGIGRSTVQEAIGNAADIAENCDVEIRPTLGLPVFTGSDRDDLAMFLDLVEEGFRRKVTDSGRDHNLYMRRVETETRLICDKGLSGYFLVVHDYIKAAKTGSWVQRVRAGAEKEPILVGPGRGSGGGSLVAWLLDITAIDPIRYDLLFERFLTPSRKGYPDIDSDFPRSKRAGIKSYVEARYGHDHVCTIGTTIRNAPKGMLRDLGRAMGINYNDINQMSKIIMAAAKLAASEEAAAEEGEDEVGWDEIVSLKGGDLAVWARKYPELFEKLGEMVGLARQYGVHPSGVLVNAEPLLGRIPLRTRKHNTREEVVTTQFDMDEVEAMGGVKFDLLGIRHLDTLTVAQELVKERYGYHIDFEDLDFDVPKMWEQVDKGHTTGIFQIETPGATRTAVELKPRSVEDVAHLVSIIRPGVKDAGLTERFLARRSGVEPTSFDHPLMEPIVGNTYGILVYQEQMIRAAKELAGFSVDEADDLRRITAKKKASEIGPWQNKFFEGCLGNKVFMDPIPRLGSPQEMLDEAERIAAKIWASIHASARYVFNQAHAIGYALLSVQEIWVKHHFVMEYLVALLATDANNTNRYIRDTRRHGIAILPPDVNMSSQKFVITKEGIRYGLQDVRGVGAAVARSIISGRPYHSPEDFFVDAERVGKTQVINLIKIGALDSFGDRAQMLMRYQRHRILQSVAPRKRAGLSPEQADEIVADKLTSYPDKWVIDVPDFSDEQVLYEIEKELVGTYVTVDPMGRYLDVLDSITDVYHPDDIANFTPGTKFHLGGQVTRIKLHAVSKGRTQGQEMAFINLQWAEEDFDFVVFPELWGRVGPMVRPGVPVACTLVKTDRGCSLLELYRLDQFFREAQ